ncbi:HlyC/CorC family transporter [Peribacillus psychrosaccharolyticus]|uniref:HlyC/CorC family transporter n=1 Tax=Peribacillus psychrosaccharolyticus TaxID=1407 RepID=A0A974S259_PERPY|nr:hemolysin family protein [Peribacillus psychrosaccharolyticus]MEC2054888.1 hemolysin family protein [Peribacillus psychrosaccharolyticus]MED3744669.1 hemolysin family protein [Peribacillus psychrosaccharolyticus]QQT02188.1 HlyC/CorC family transporter [Peribacillus psychrosaccharolyticus]
MDIFNLILVFILIALTAFFVACEFSIIRVRGSKIDQLIEEGHPRAEAARQVTGNLDEYLSATQLGITITALGLGWIGEPTMKSILAPVLEKLHISADVSGILIFLIAFSVITFLNVVVGELAPKTIAIQRAEQVSLLISKPLIMFHKIAFPFIWLLNHSARLVTGLFGLKPASEGEIAHSEEELRMILSESYKSGEINQAEYKYVNNIFEFDDRIAKEIMVPRTEIITLYNDGTIQEFIDIVKEEKFTRYPIVDGDKDHIIGMINIKEVFSDFVKKRKSPSTSLKPYTRPVIRVMENIPIHDLLVKMQKERIHMAVLMDEYGGTSGLVTVDDILEEIVGEIRDEFDIDEVPSIRKIKDGHYMFDAKVLVKEVNDLLGIHLNEEDVDTIGGWILTENYDVHENDIIEKDGFCFKVIEMEDHSIKCIEVTKNLERLRLENEINIEN